MGPCQDFGQLFFPPTLPEWKMYLPCKHRKRLCSKLTFWCISTIGQIFLCALFDHNKPVEQEITSKDHNLELKWLTISGHWPENATKQQEPLVQADAVPDEARLGFQFFFQLEEYVFDLFIPSQRCDICVLQWNIVAQLQQRNQPVKGQPGRWETLKPKSILKREEDSSLKLRLRPCQTVYGWNYGKSQLIWLYDKCESVSHPKSWKAISGIIPGQCHTIWPLAGRKGRPHIPILTRS